MTRGSPALATGITDAYSASGTAWQAGPGRIYERLAEVLVARCPGRVAGRRVLDLGAGTGAATRAASAAGAASVVALDPALGMLAGWPRHRPPAVAADARRLPFAAEAFGAVVAAFSLNHLVDPVVALRQIRGVLAPGGGLVVGAYAEGDAHPAKQAVDDALRATGWTPAPWYGDFRARAVPRLATTVRALDVAARAGLGGAAAAQVAVPFEHLAPADLVAWRLGMAHAAPFVARLSPVERAALVADAEARLGEGPPPLVRQIVVMTWTAG